MPDARVIPIGGDDAPRRSAAADAVAAGASRASGERSRRPRVTPLLDGSTAPDPQSPAPRPARRRTTSRPATPTPPVDTPAAEAEPVAPAAVELPDWERKVAGALAFVRRRLTGDVEVDEFGFDPELTDKVLLAALRPLYEHYFRVEARGLENIPSEGGALVVANHSGTVPLDSVMTQIALLDHHPAHRHLRMLGADLVFQTPLVSELARKSGTTLACNADAERLLGTRRARGRLAGGLQGHRQAVLRALQAAALRPRWVRVGGAAARRCRSCRARSSGPRRSTRSSATCKTLARLLGLPYLPITPTFPWLGPLGAMPLPSKWIIEFGEPIETDGYGIGAADDPMLVFNLTDQVRETIQHTLYRLLMSRRSIFF